MALIEAKTVAAALVKSIRFEAVNKDDSVDDLYALTASPVIALKDGFPVKCTIRN